MEQAGDGRAGGPEGLGDLGERPGFEVVHLDGPALVFGESGEGLGEPE
jgi:hypothetical protein